MTYRQCVFLLKTETNEMGHKSDGGKQNLFRWNSFSAFSWKKPKMFVWLPGRGRVCMYLARIFECMVAAQFGWQQDNPRKNPRSDPRIYPSIVLLTTSSTFSWLLVYGIHLGLLLGRSSWRILVPFYFWWAVLDDRLIIIIITSSVRKNIALTNNIKWHTERRRFI